MLSKYFATELRTQLSSLAQYVTVPWSLTGRTLQEVENPYDKAVRIQQANRELFSQPVTRKKHPSRVKFDLVPKMVDGPQVEVVTGEGSDPPSRDTLWPSSIIYF